MKVGLGRAVGALVVAGSVAFSGIAPASADGAPALTSGNVLAREGNKQKEAVAIVNVHLSQPANTAYRLDYHTVEGIDAKDGRKVKGQLGPERRDFKPVNKGMVKVWPGTTDIQIVIKLKGDKKSESIPCEDFYVVFDQMIVPSSGLQADDLGYTMPADVTIRIADDDNPWNDADQDGVADCQHPDLDVPVEE